MTARIKKLTIRQMLIAWAVVGVASVIILAGAGMFSNASLSSNQEKLINTLPFEASSRGISIVVTDLIIRQGNVISAGTSTDLEPLTDRSRLENAFKAERDKLAHIEGSVKGAGGVLGKLDKTYADFLKTDNLLFEKTTDILALREQLDARNNAIDATVKDIKDTAESISGKVNFATKKIERKIRRAVNKRGNETQFRSLVSDLIVGKRSDIQNKSSDIRTGVATLATLSRKVMLEDNVDALTSIKDNQIVQTIQLISGSLDSLRQGFESSPELLTLTQKLDGDFSMLVSLLVEGDDSAFALRMKSLAQEKELEALLGSVQTSVSSMMKGLSDLSQLAAAIRTSAVKESQSVVKASNMTVLSVGAVTLATLLLFMILIIRAVTQPLQEAVDISNRLAEGDLTVNIDVKSDNETGQLLKAMNNMVEKLKEIVSSVATATTEVNSSSSEISAAVEQEMAVATEQSTSVSEITSTMEELSQTSTHISENSNSVLEISTNTLHETEKGAEAAKTLLDKMSEINDDNQQSIHEIVELGKKSQEITTVMEIINNIADQTKLIAFNAAIEASGAGEAGKRFGVVAVEIRRLADNVMESTTEIQNKINEIQNAINNLVVASEKGSKGIQEGMGFTNQTVDMLSKVVEGARSTTNAAKQITLSTQQQKTASDQVVLSLKEITEGTSQISTSISQTNSITKTLTDLSGNLMKLVDKFKLGSEEKADEGKKQEAETEEEKMKIKGNGHEAEQTVEQ
jgi:methyl-accepting chemotaxis protein